jgi:hypothetical protein
MVDIYSEQFKDITKKHISRRLSREDEDIISRIRKRYHLAEVSNNSKSKHAVLALGPKDRALKS